MKNSLDYDKIIKFAEERDIRLMEYQKKMLKAMCSGERAVFPRQCGIKSSIELIHEYLNDKNCNKGF